MREDHAQEVAQGKRFEFGQNWKRFLAHLSESRIEQAMNSLTTMLGMSDLKGKRFMDAGSGSGLFSLAARRLGASVYSIDFDPSSVACTQELKCLYFDGDGEWRVEEASVLDRTRLRQFGQFDVVYSWGVLHHTGAMWQAIENVSNLVMSGGYLFIAIYNDQGRMSRYWARIKQTYVRFPWTRWPLIVLHIPCPFLTSLVVQGLTGRLGRERGMSLWHDLIDWIGGYPYEVARPEDIVRFLSDRGFTLSELKTTCRLGCNEFVFRRSAAASSAEQ